MEDHQKHYLEKMGSRIEALVAARSGLKDDFFEAASSIRRLAHTLKGSGATYGFPKISELAAAAEDAQDHALPSALDDLIAHLQSLYQDQRGAQEKILVVDDSDEIRLMLDVILKAQGYHVSTVETAQAGFAELKEADYDLLILDLVLPDMDGRNFLIKLREDSRTAQIPVMVLSAKNSPQIKAECFALGADEYFEKPLNPALLTTRVAVSLQRSRQMEKQTRRDTLTGLYNRAAFTEAFQQLVQDRSAESGSSCIAMIDIDHFKKINDAHGHLVGDQVLQYISTLLKTHLPDPCILARWGGEEFAALLPNMTHPEAKALLATALRDLEKRPFLTEKKEQISPSFSGGLISFSGDKDLNKLLGKADQLLYEAKAAGRGCICTVDDNPGTKPKRILIAEDDDLTAEFILHRLKKDGFETDHFQRGDRALEAAREQHYDLALFDVKMPGMEGFELLQRTRSESLNKDTPVIMLTSMGSEQDISRGLALGANDYVLKPFSPMELMARIRRLLK